MDFVWRTSSGGLRLSHVGHLGVREWTMNLTHGPKLWSRRVLIAGRRPHAPGDTGLGASGCIQGGDAPDLRGSSQGTSRLGRTGLLPSYEMNGVPWEGANRSTSGIRGRQALPSGPAARCDPTRDAYDGAADARRSDPDSAGAPATPTLRDGRHPRRQTTRSRLAIVVRRGRGPPTNRYFINNAQLEPRIAMRTRGYPTRTRSARYCRPAKQCSNSAPAAETGYLQAAFATTAPPLYVVQLQAEHAPSSAAEVRPAATDLHVAGARTPRSTTNAMRARATRHGRHLLTALSSISIILNETFI